MRIAPPFIEMLPTLFEAMPAGMLVYNKEGEILLTNRRGSEILEMYGDDLSSLNSLQVHLSRNIKDSGNFPGVLSRTEWTLEREGETGLTMGYSVTPFNNYFEGRSSRFYLVLFQDITEHVKRRKEYARSLRVGAMSKLLPTIAHEIKNPLASIQSIVEVVKEELNTPQHSEDMTLILEEINRLRAIVDRMRLAEEDLLNTRETVDLEQVAQRAIRLIQKRADALRVQVYAQVEPIVVNVHPEMFHMILLNLLNNSLDACEEGDRVVVSLNLHRNSLTLCVTDNGRGMSPETLQHATEPFYTTKNGGSGIGLALVHEIVSRSGGSMALWSQENQGTRITIEIKVKP